MSKSEKSQKNSDSASGVEQTGGCRLRALVVALAGGGAGGYLFHLAGLPLAWMLGAMAAVTALSLMGAKPRIPQPLRMGMLGVLGVMLGASFRPGLLDHVTQWWPSMIGLLVLTVITPFAASRLFKAHGHDPVTSYFASAPGGINEMVTMGGSLGGDERTIALVHALRILFVVFSVPIWFLLSGQAYPETQAAHHVPWSAMLGAPLGVALLLGCALFGRPLGALLRLPAAQLTGPMALSAAVHLAGWSQLEPPSDLVAIAQVVVGAALGARFVGVAPRALIKTALIAVGSSALMIALAMIAAGTVGGATGLSFILLLLSFVPGGVAEMSLVSMALGMDIAFVATHHMVRITLVISLAPLAFRWWWHRQGKSDEARHE